jgi:hypothetical protein
VHIVWLKDIILDAWGKVVMQVVMTTSPSDRI